MSILKMCNKMEMNAINAIFYVMQERMKKKRKKYRKKGYERRKRKHTAYL